MPGRRLRLMVEGPGDRLAAPYLIRKILQHMSADYGEHLVVENSETMVLGGLSALSGDSWRKKLLSATRCEPAKFGGVLLLLDGDVKPIKQEPFCPVHAARHLAGQATNWGAGTTFSLAVVFACREFESWLIAGVESLAGKNLGDGRPGVNEGIVCPQVDLEVSLRGAKEWLDRSMPYGYKASQDQAELTKFVDLDLIRSKKLRSFQRLESALKQLLDAFRTGSHIATPRQYDGG